MPSIGLICEGATDVEVLHPLLAGVLGREVSIADIQPPRHPGAHGGWQGVFASIRRGDIRGALSYHDAVVVQIDTDVCEEQGFGVPRKVEGKKRTHEELALAVGTRLRDLIQEADPTVDLARVALAVSVQEMECWLLLHLSPEERRDHNCIHALNQVLKQRGGSEVSDRSGKKFPRAYTTAARDLRRPKSILAMSGRSPSFDLFCAAVQAWPLD